MSSSPIGIVPPLEISGIVPPVGVISGVVPSDWQSRPLPVVQAVKLVLLPLRTV